MKKQLDLFYHFTWKIRGSNGDVLGANKKLSKAFQSEFVELLCWDGNCIAARNSTRCIFPWLISLRDACHFFCLQAFQSCMCADFPHKDKQWVVARLWITKLNKQFYEQRRISACETPAVEATVCFLSIVFFQCQSLPALWINSLTPALFFLPLLTHITCTQTSTYTHFFKWMPLSHTTVTGTNFLTFSASVCFLTLC